MTVARPAHLSLFLSLTLALAGLPLRAQVPAADPAPAAASEPAAAPAPEKTPRPATAEPEKTPKRAKPDDDDDRPARTRRKAAATPAPMLVAATAAATPKPGFLRRVFGSNKKPAATPAPIATPTPKPKPKVKKEDDDEVKPKPKKDEDEETKPKKNTEKTPSVTEPPLTGEAGEPNLNAKPPKATPVPRGKKGAAAKEPVKTAAHGAAKEQLALEQALKGGDADVIERARYEYARARAVDDEHVRDLKAKADGASSEEEGRKSLRAYNRALYDKMRKLEPTVSDRIDRMEAIVLKRIGGSED